MIDDNQAERSVMDMYSVLQEKESNMVRGCTFFYLPTAGK